MGSTGANVVNSNLGGQGGAVDPNGPSYVQINNAGTAVTNNADNGATVAVRLTALTPYQTNNANVNGLQNGNGEFMIVNMLSPDSNNPSFHPSLAYVDLRLELLNQATGQPLNVFGGHETYLSIYDLDSRDGGPLECFQARVPIGTNGGRIAPRAALPPLAGWLDFANRRPSTHWRQVCSQWCRSTASRPFLLARAP